MSLFPLTYPPGVQTNIQATLDSLMSLEGRTCILYFPPIPTAISGGQSFNPPVGTDITTNTWAAGMPMPVFSQENFNPYSDGKNIVEIEQTGVVTMVIYSNPTKFNDIFPIGERKEEGLIISKGYITDLEKVLNAVRMETFVEAGTNHYKYKLEGEPVIMSTLIKTRYFFALWSRL